MSDSKENQSKPKENPILDRYNIFTANMTWNLLGILFVIIGCYNKYGFFDTCLILGLLLLGTFVFLDIKFLLIYHFFTRR